jgi:hypothetical protein
MIEGIFGPKWFAEADILIDTLSLIVLFLIGYFSIKYYKIDKNNKNYLYLGLSFLILSLSFIFLILINFFAYYDIVQLGYEILSIGYNLEIWPNIFIFYALLVYRLLTLFGLYFLFSIYKKQTKSIILIISYLIVISTLFSISAYYIFHLTSLIFLSLITVEYSKQFLKTKYPGTKLLTYSFGIIAVSQIVSIFIKVHIAFYVLSQFIQLLGYSLLLITFILVLKHGKKDKD